MLKITVRQIGTRDFPTEANVVQPIVRDLAQVVYDETQEGADKHTKSGALFQSVFNRKTTTGRAVGHDTGRAPHAEFVLFGTRPHEIKGKPVTPRKVYAKNGGVLGGIFRRWYVKTQKTLRFAIGGRFIFANSVKHPGYKGDHYLNDAARTAVSRFDEILKRHWKE